MGLTKLDYLESLRPIQSFQQIPGGNNAEGRLGALAGTRNNNRHQTRMGAGKCDPCHVHLCLQLLGKPERDTFGTKQ